MQKAKLPPVDMKHVSKYTEEIIEKLKKKGWKYKEALNLWANRVETCGFLHHEDSFRWKIATSNNKEFFKLPEFSYRKWNRITAISYTGKNSDIYGIRLEWIIEINRALKRLQYNKKIFSDIVLGFPPEDDVVIAFIPYRKDYARFVIAPMLMREPLTYHQARISGTSYIEPEYLFYDIKADIIGPLYKGRIITIDEYKQKWVEHILSNS